MQPASSFLHQQNISGVHGSEGAQTFVGHAGRDVIFSGSKDPQATMDEAIDNCRSSLFLSDPEIDRANLIGAKGERVEGTCEWIEKNEKYHSWLRGDQRLLWICGGPGQGKTMLSIFLTERLEIRTQAVYYFCSGEDEQRNNATAILRGLLWRITVKRRELTRHMLDYFATPELAQATLSSRETLWSLFKTVLQDPELGELVCLLDGLDECTSESSRWLILKLVRFFGTEPIKSSNINMPRMVVVSRDIPALRQTAQIRLAPDNDEQVACDIKQFASAKVREFSGLDGYSEVFRETVETAILTRAEGTFLWIGFVMDELSRKATCTEVLASLKSLPYGLHAYYSRMLLQIQPVHRETSALMLRWITMAQRHLTLRELGSVIGVQNSATVDVDRSIRDQVKMCGALVKVQGQDVSLVHHSAREYLLRTQPSENAVLEEFRIIPETVNLQIARSCLACIERSRLSHKALSDSDTDLRDVHMLEYSINFWPKHAAGDSVRAGTIFKCFTQFFAKESKLRDNWWRTYLALNPRLKWYQEVPGETNALPLHIASYLGLTEWVRLLLATSNKKPKISLSERKKGFDTVLPLLYAASMGHDKIATILLDYGADINGQNDKQQTALLQASRLGHEDTVLVLLGRGAKVNNEDKPSDTVLHHAASAGLEGPVRLLIQYGADVIARNERGQTPLFSAIIAGHEAVVRLLLDSGAKVNDKDSSGLKMLSCAARAGHESTMRLLIERGANFFTQDKNDALHHSVGAGQPATVKSLLDFGANPNALDEDGSTPLSKARRLADSTSEAVVGLLLDYGADISEHDTAGDPLLHWAASRSWQLTMRLLQEFSVDIHARSRRGETALHRAASVEDQSIAQLLIDRGARVNDVDQDKETALHKAIWWSRHTAEPMVRLLLESEAELHTRYRSGATLLYHAVWREDDGVVRALLDHGARVDDTNVDGSTALHAAASRLNESIIRLLLESGANPCLTTERGKAALHYAAARGNGAASTRVLLEYGAAVNVKDSRGHEPLYYAAWGTNEEVVSSLLECGANIHIMHDGMTALHRAALAGHKAVVQTLLDHGAIVNKPGSDGRTALCLASMEGNVSAVRLLLESGAHVHARDNDGTTSLHKAAQRGHEGVVGILLEHGADPADQDNDGNTALASAESRRHIAVVRLLLSSRVTSAVLPATGRSAASRKLVFVGDGQCGKTCLLTVFCKGMFPGYNSGLSCDQFEGNIQSDGLEVQLTMWDMPGQEEYDRLRPLAYPGSHVALICFGIDSPDSLDNVEEKWISEVHHFCHGLPIMLVGCRKDLRYDQLTIEDLFRTSQKPVSPEEGEDVCRKIGAQVYLECSARTDEGVREVFLHASLAAMLTRKKQKNKGCWVM
ncbi:hypothetical protein LTR17_024043 [Elasticomyces elasticus]|nr:hypothetical protein LTR17_024043 [Elasticomyces elasticus]